MFQFRSFGRREAFCGPCDTLASFEFHEPVLEVLRQPGQGRVLFVDGGGSLRVGVLGDRLAEIGVASGWAGVVVLGAVRDSLGIDRLDFGVKALGATARKAFSGSPGRHGSRLQIGDLVVEPGNWVYADRDCVLVSRGKNDVRAAAG